MLIVAGGVAGRFVGRCVLLGVHPISVAETLHNFYAAQFDRRCIVLLLHVLYHPCEKYKVALFEVGP